MDTALTQKTEKLNPNQLLEIAVNKDLDIEKLGKLMELQRQWEADQARKSFFAALAEFQSKCPEIRKNKLVSFTTQQGGKTEYHYAPLADIERQIKELMHDCGLTKRWETSDEGGKLVVTCIITHTDGHSEKSTMSAPADDSGKKNAIQARASSISYMQRYTLIGALGIGTADADIDGRFNEKDVDDLHKDFMKLYNELIQINPTFDRLHPDNWKGERNVKNYIRAIGEIRKLHYDEVAKAKKVQ